MYVSHATFVVLAPASCGIVLSAVAFAHRLPSDSALLAMPQWECGRTRPNTG